MGEWFLSLWRAYSFSHPCVSVVCVGSPAQCSRQRARPTPQTEAPTAPRKGNSSSCVTYGIVSAAMIPVVFSGDVDAVTVEILLDLENTSMQSILPLLTSVVFIVFAWRVCMCLFLFVSMLYWHVILSIFHCWQWKVAMYVHHCQKEMKERWSSSFRTLPEHTSRAMRHIFIGQWSSHGCSWRLRENSWWVVFNKSLSRWCNWSKIKPKNK